MFETEPSKSAVADETRRVIAKAHAAGKLEDLTRRSITRIVAENIGVDEEDLRLYKPLLKETIEDTVKQLYGQDDEKEVSDDGKRKRAQEEESPVPQKKKKVKKEATPPKSPSPSPTPVDSSKQSDDTIEDAGKSESEMSVLIDEEPPKRKKKSTKKDRDHTSKPAPKKSRGKAELSKNEETIKKYKSLILGCGVRKQWAKELAHCNSESQQISHLRNMLTDLGMSGRMSMEQAKAIREKRELRQEIEDVVQFEKAKGINAASRGSRSKDKKKSKVAEGSDAEDDASESDLEEYAKRLTAKKSVLAFLADQSDDEE